MTLLGPDDPRRIGHHLTTHRVTRGPGAGAGPGTQYGTTGRCECSPDARFRSSVAPSRGGLRQVQRSHARHVATVEGPALPALSRPQRDALRGADASGELTSGGDRTRQTLIRLGLVRLERGFRLTAEGWRAVALLRRAATETPLTYQRGAG